MWTVNDAAGTPLEATAHETGANAIAGPTTGCSAPLERVQITGSETVPPSKPRRGHGGVSNFNTVTLNWGAATDAESGVAELRPVPRQRLRAGRGRDGAERRTPPRRRRRTTSTRTSQPARTRTRVRATDAANNDGPAAIRAIRSSRPPPAAGQGTVNEPPAGTHSIIGFPERDFISADGYTDAATVDVQIIRGGNIVAGADGMCRRAPPASSR